jgi:hypothetical protein
MMVVAKAFDGERELIQGLSEVERYGDRCVRVQVAHVPLIDRDREAASLALLYKFRMIHAPKKPVA